MHNNKQNHRTTQQRKVILEELKKVKSHPAADEIYRMVRKRLPRISLGTVYRNLEVLSELKEIQQIELAGSLKRFDGNPENHYHLRCIICGRIDDAPFELENNLEKQMRTFTDYTIISHKLEFIGICPECSSKLP
ncbi:MAG: transcriptional repressor [Desulfobacterium sp.]|nr:transcriptional repressor [Desulfobacterium sp.]MBU3947358.1 transcriptional repressor [Pseudomonadota bacterium]MBU4036317.1 transcriptional repressor [Pseudomonadota bacterium]